MPTDKLFFYSDGFEEVDALISKLQIHLKESKEKKGFYLERLSYGRSLVTPLEVTILKAISKESLLQLKQSLRSNPLLNIYILTHKLFNFEQVLDQLKLCHVNCKNIHLLCGANSENNLVYAFKEIEKKYPSYSKIKIQFKNEEPLKKPAQRYLAFIPYTLIDLLKWFINPLVELKHFLNVHIHIYFKRFLEFFDFLHYLLFKTFWFLRYQYYTRVKKQLWME